MFCAGCGNQIPDGASFCIVCGRPVTGAFNAYPSYKWAARGNQPDLGARKMALYFIFSIFMIVPVIELIVAQVIWNKTSVRIAYKIYQMLRKGDDNDNIARLRVLAMILAAVVIGLFVIFMIGMCLLKSARPVFFMFIMISNYAATIAFIIFIMSIKPKNMYLKNYNGVIPFKEISLIVIAITAFYLVFTIWGTWLAKSLKKYGVFSVKR